MQILQIINLLAACCEYITNNDSAVSCDCGRRPSAYHDGRSLFNRLIEAVQKLSVEALDKPHVDNSRLPKWWHVILRLAPPDGCGWRGGKIRIIKSIRQHAGRSLKEAKRLADRVWHDADCCHLDYLMVPAEFTLKEATSICQDLRQQCGHHVEWAAIKPLENS